MIYLDLSEKVFKEVYFKNMSENTLLINILSLPGGGKPYLTSQDSGVLDQNKHTFAVIKGHDGEISAAHGVFITSYLTSNYLLPLLSAGLTSLISAKAVLSFYLGKLANVLGEVIRV